MAIDWKDALPRILVEASPSLVADLRFFRQFARIAESMGQIATFSDDLLRNLAFDRCRHISEQFTSLAAGRIDFSASESWRTIYEEVLRGPGVTDYRSVAVVEDESYWSDEPGRRSMELNYRLVREKPLIIQRVCIICDSLWPPDSPLPGGHLREWLDDQFRNGIQLYLVRRSELSGEPDLVEDLGIYGIRAVGFHRTCDDVSSARYTLSFNIDDLQQAEEQWERLGKLFAIPFEDLVGTPL